MTKLREKIIKTMGDPNFKRRFLFFMPYLVIGFAFTLLLVDEAFLGGGLLDIVSAFDFIVFVLMTLVSLVIIGKAVMKALFHISAGLSLIIFLAQSYCSAQNQSANSDLALKFLFLVGLIYLIFDFSKIFYKGISDYMEPFSKIKREYFWKMLLAVYFFIIIVAFFFSIYLVIKPIFLNICIFQ